MSDLSRRTILLNSDPEPAEALLALETGAFGLVWLIGSAFPILCRAPVASGLLVTFGDETLHLIGALLLCLAVAQLGAVYHDVLATRRAVLCLQAGWWLFVSCQYLFVFGLSAVGPLLFLLFFVKACWAAWRLFRKGVRDSHAGA